MYLALVGTASSLKPRIYADFGRENALTHGRVEGWGAAGRRKPDVLLSEEAHDQRSPARCRRERGAPGR